METIFMSEMPVQ